MRRSSNKRLALLVAGLLFATSRDALADDLEETAPLGPAFRYQTPAEPNVVRAALEDALILGGGYAQYTLDKSNERDWDLSADWPALRSKLVFDSLSFDDNHFPTNWVTHPLAGWAYYSAARGNRVPIPLSFAMAFASSFIWEYIGELREHAALNDLVVTPVAGVPFGEGMLQLGGLLHRSHRTPLSTSLGLVFAPFKSVHDWTDDLDPEPASVVDDYGLAADVWHQIRVGSAAGVTSQAYGVVQGDGRFFGESRIVSLPGYGGAGRHSGWFESGEVTDLRLQATTSNANLVDFLASGELVAIGYDQQDVRTERGGALAGTGTLGGVLVATEYGTHDYDRDRRRDIDRIAMVAAGPTFEERIHTEGAFVRLRLDALFDFAGVDAYALPEYARDYGDLRLTSVLRNERYYHAYGVTVRPRVDATLGRWDAGADARFDGFDGITLADVAPDPAGGRVASRDTRIIGMAWAGFSPTRHLRISLTGEGRERAGSVGPARASRSEVSVYGGIEVRF